VVDDELTVGPEEVGKRDGLLLAGLVERGEYVWLGDFDDGQVAALGRDGVTRAREVLFLLEEREAGDAVFGRRGDLQTRRRLGRSGRKKGETWGGQGILLQWPSLWSVVRYGRACGKARS
jgi:hypothetical protein